MNVQIYKRNIIYHIIRIFMNSTPTGKCCPTELLQNPDVHEHFTCSICFQVMAEPTRLNCQAGHIFGKACIEQWIVVKENTQCPLCRGNVNTLKQQDKLKTQTNDLSIKCKYCAYSHKVKSYAKHDDLCEMKEEFYQKELIATVADLKQFLNANLFGHYNEKHKQEMLKYILGEENQKDLETNTRDWNWWWNVNPEWNQGCKECEKLWNVFGVDIHFLDNKRKRSIQLIDREFVLQHIREIFY